MKASHLSKYKDIAWLFFKYGRGDLIKGSKFDDGTHENGREIVRSPLAEELASDLEKMGPVFVKIGQLLSTRPDFLPLAYVEALARLQDKVEPFAFEKAQEIVESELGARLSRVFSSFESRPISAASLGQVHKATLRDGRVVAVKVQRPGIRERMVTDLEAIGEVAEFLDRHTQIGKRYEFSRILEQFRNTLIRELDYRLEAQNLKTLAANLKEFPRLLVPLPIEDFSTSRVLTMDFVAGYKLNALSPVIKTELDGKGLAEELFRAYLKQILVDGFFHADPHPGNVLLREDFSIALIDLGMVGHLGPVLQENLLRILLAISEGRSEDVTEQLLEVSELRKEADKKEFGRHVAELVAQNQRVTLQQVAIGRLIMEMNKVAADCGIRAPAELSTLGKTLLNLDELGKTLDPAFDPNVSVRKNATAILQRRLLKSLSPGNLYSGILEAKEFMQHLPGKISKILTTVANNEIEVKVHAIDEAKLMTGFQKVANRIAVGLILAALIVGAALLMRVDTPFRIAGYPGLAIILFILAAMGGIALVVRMLFYDQRQ